MDITHYYLHTCFKFRTDKYRLASYAYHLLYSDTKSLKTILEQKDILRFELRT